MPASKNTWNKGLNSDFSKLKSQQDSYLDAKNIRVMTDEGSSTFAIENIRGNEFSFNIPSVEATYTITKDPLIFDQPVYVDLQRGGDYVSLEITNVENKSYEDITDGLNISLQNTSFPGKEYIRFYFNSKGIVLYDFLPQSSTLTSLILTTFDIDSKVRTNKINSHTILGWGYYNNTIVLITCDVTNNSEEPVNKEGFIWAATYDNATNTIQVSDLDGNYLNPNTTLKYAGKLDLSRQYAIYKHLKCRYENNYTARVVWTDNYNNLKTCNILDPQIFASPPELFSYIPVHLPQKPIISIINGGALPSGKYHYFYQLLSSQGAISSFSPLSNLMVAYPGDSINYATPGASQGTPAQKSMQVFIQNIDTNYDTIRVGYVVYQVADVPEAFFFDERQINGSSMTFVHNGGTENDVSIDDVLIANLNRAPEVFKTIDVVRNRLFAANAKTRQFDLTEVFDARAYRFDSTGIARLYNSTDSWGNPSVVIDIDKNTISIEEDDAVSPIDYTLIPETFDCINPFNQENNAYTPYSNGDWYTYSQYKYQNFPPTIIGGKGLNISYQFVTKEMEAKASNFVTASNFINPQSNFDINYTYEFSDTYTYPGGRGLTMDCMKNPTLETLFTGYSRGEVYRFGIVFFDVYGFPSYPLWIGDIKFPFAYEEDDIGDSFGLTKLNTVRPTYDRNTFIAIGDYTQVPNINPSADTFDMMQPGSVTLTVLKGPNFSQTISTVIAAIGTRAEYKFQYDENVLGYEQYGITVSLPDGFPAISYEASNTTGPYAGTNAGFWDGKYIQITKVLLGVTYISIAYVFPTFFPAGVTPNNPVVVKQLGITFSLDTSGAQFQAIKDKISGYSYVRLKRDVANSTRLGTGYIQPTYNMQKDDKYMLTPFEWNSNQGSTGFKWGYDLGSGGAYGDNVRLGLQMYYAPNFLGQSLPAFAPGDYFRFIGRTYDYDYLRRYAAPITTPSFGTNYAYYVASNDFLYTYDDSTIPFPYLTEINQQQFTNSFLSSNSIFPISTRTSIPYSTSQNEVTIPAGPGSSSVIFRNMSNANIPDASTGNYSEWGVECLGVTFNGDISDFPNTAAIFRPSIVQFPFYLVSYERYLIEQYGGSTRGDRYDNQYILTNHFQPIDGASNLFSDVYGGDTYVNYFDYQRTNVNFTDASGGSGYGTENNSGDNQPGRGVAIFFPAESTFNTDLNLSAQRAAVRQNTDSIFASNYQFNAAYSQQNTTNVFISKGYLQSNVIEEPHTIYPSEEKKDGESGDSWRTLLINNALSVNGNYGEINRVVQFKDKLFFYQNDGVGVAAVDERVLSNEGSPDQTQLGTGTVLQRFDYISTETGCKHSFAVEATGSSIYHYDSFVNKLFKYSVGKTKDDIAGMNPLTDIKGLSGFFRTAFIGSTIKSEDKILNLDNRVGIVSSFNSEYNSIYFTFFDQANNIQHTISYNELLDSFESFYDFYPSMYLNMRKRFVSIAPITSSEVYTHNTGIRNTFYNTYFDSSVTFRVNENSDFVKTFDNFQVNSEVILNNIQLAETITIMYISNDYQETSIGIVNFTQKIRSWRLAIPRDETNPALTIKPRISDKYMDVKFIFNAEYNLPYDTNKVFRLHDVITEYSMRSKIVPK
jgi:hypothetical protein